MDVCVYAPANETVVCVCVFASMLLISTFVYRDDVRVAEGRHDLDLPADVDHVLLFLDLLLPNRLDSHLERVQRTECIWIQAAFSVSNINVVQP